MTIEEFLKNPGTRLTYGNKWLVRYYVTEDTWVVYSHEPYQHGITTEYRGTDLSEALKALKGEN
jgi:hypothetical protein